MSGDKLKKTAKMVGYLEKRGKMVSINKGGEKNFSGGMRGMSHNFR